MVRTWRGKDREECLPVVLSVNCKSIGKEASKEEEEALDESGGVMEEDAFASES